MCCPMVAPSLSVTGMHRLIKHQHAQRPWNVGCQRDRSVIKAVGSAAEETILDKQARLLSNQATSRNFKPSTRMTRELSSSFFVSSDVSWEGTEKAINRERTETPNVQLPRLDVEL